jgi:hypothetical protein
VADVAAADVEDAMAAAVVVAATVAAAAQAADGTSIRRIHRRRQIKKGRNARCGLSCLLSAGLSVAMAMLENSQQVCSNVRAVDTCRYQDRSLNQV